MFGNPLLLADDGYQISRSVRLRSSASAYFNRTLGAATNNTIWSLSMWVKRGTLSNSNSYLIEAYTNGTNRTPIEFTSANALQMYYLSGGTLIWQLTTTPVFRDPSAWYHVVVNFNSNLATASDRVQMYVNGVRITSFSTASYPSLGQATQMNLGSANSVIHYLGVEPGTPAYFDGYLTEVNFIDGQALTPSSFGETDAITGVWKPKKYAGTYGTNGFFLNFSDNSSNTATTIGKDYSGNGNNWTPNNISVTSGVTYDSMLDVPTLWADGGNGRGNYAVLNPLIRQAAASSNLIAANLEQNTTLTGSEVYALSTMPLPATGKFYAEFSIVAASGLNTANSEIGLVSGPRTSGDNSGRLDQCPSSTVYRADGQKGIDASFSAYGSSWGNGDTIGVAVDMDAASVTFYKNNTSQGAITSLDTQDVFMGVCLRVSGGTGYAYANFGQRPFAYTPPTGFKALNTQNLPQPTIPNGASYMNAITYTGDGTSTRTIGGLAFQPDLVWNKQRSGTFPNILVDSVRGGSPGLAVLISNATDAEYTTLGAGGGISAITSSGFTTTAGSSSNNNLNGSGSTYVAWQWKEGATQGFDIVTYTGTGANTTVAHSLGVAPRMIIFKRRSAVANWAVYHASIGNTGALALDLTIATDTNVAYFNNTSPTSSVFTVGTGNSVNASTSTYVAYLFAEVAGFSRAFSYTGNGSADGPFIFLGFRPRWVMIKRTDTAEAWTIVDTSRTTTNKNSVEYLIPNSSGAEFTDTNSEYDILSNGFKLRDTGSLSNGSGGTYIGMAFAEVPFKFSLGR